MRVTSEKIKFADDGTIWITGKDWHELVERFKENFKEIILAWAKNGDFNLVLSRQNFVCFHRVIKF